MKEKHEYKVEGYDKDNDVYVEYYRCEDLDEAKKIAKILDGIACNDELIRYDSDHEKEPIDWVHVSDENDERVYLPRREQVAMKYWDDFI